MRRALIGRGRRPFQNSEPRCGLAAYSRKSRYAARALTHSLIHALMPWPFIDSSAYVLLGHIIISCYPWT